MSGPQTELELALLGYETCASIKLSAVAKEATVAATRNKIWGILDVLYEVEIQIYHPMDDYTWTSLRNKKPDA